MTFHPAIIDEAMTEVCQSERFESCDIIIGDNSCGKSFLLKKDSATYGITGEYLFYRCSKQRI